jgi:hypothetical protein
VTTLYHGYNVHPPPVAGVIYGRTHISQQAAARALAERDAMKEKASKLMQRVRPPSPPSPTHPRPAPCDLPESLGGIVYRCLHLVPWMNCVPFPKSRKNFSVQCVTAASVSRSLGVFNP